jgi:hypothetical protein
MPSSFSPNLRIELIGNGEQAGTWGTTTNTNLGTLVEDAISGYETVSVTTANQALTYADGVADQARNAMIELTTTTGAAFAVYAPPSPKTYVIKNDSAYTATIYNSTVIGNTTAAGAALEIPAGTTLAVWTDGTEFAAQSTPVTLPVVASTAEAQAGTNNTAFITPLRMREGFNASGDAPVYACRAWVNFIGNATPPTILGSGNVASVTRVSTGFFRVTFTEAIQDANYASALTSSSQIIELEPNGTNATKIDILTETDAFTATNPTRVHAAVFR